MFKSLVAIFVLALVAPMAFGAPGILAGGLGLGHGSGVIVAAAPATSISVQKSIVQHPSIIATHAVAAAPIGIALGHGGIGLGGIGLGGVGLGLGGGHGW